MWVSALSVLPIVLHSLGAPLGEPVAEDFDFLRNARLIGPPSLLDGGGSLSFWRPVSHQLYYALMGSAILQHPRLVGVLHSVLLAFSAVLLYRIVRPHWSGPRAAVAASFPLLIESVRMVISWPGHSVEVGSLLFAVLALHEASRRRLATCLVALVMALLCKEVAIVATLMIPLIPWARPQPSEAAGERAGARFDLALRIRWAIATGAVTVVWALVYLYVRRTAGLALPHQLESNPATLDVPFTTRMTWATWNSLRAIVSLPAVPREWDALWGALTLGLVIVAGVAIAARSGGQARWREARAWTLWGLGWFVLSSLTLTAIFPMWAPNRALFGSVGLGLAAAALLGSAAGWLPVALVALRLAAFAVSPGPAGAVTADSPPSGAFMDFEQLTRLQRLMADTRRTLMTRYPELPPGTLIAHSNMPRHAVYAFGGPRAVQVWYQDTTLRWMGAERMTTDSTLPVTAIVQFQENREPQIALLEPGAVRAVVRATRQAERSDWDAALASLVVAESLQRDPAALVFRAEVLARRAMALRGKGDQPAAEAEARAAVAVDRKGRSARVSLALVLYTAGELEGARRQVDTLEWLFPGDQAVARIRNLVDRRRAEALPR